MIPQPLSPSGPWASVAKVLSHQIEMGEVLPDSLGRLLLEVGMASTPSAPLTEEQVMKQTKGLLTPRDLRSKLRNLTDLGLLEKKGKTFSPTYALSQPLLRLEPSEALTLIHADLPDGKYPLARRRFFKNDEVAETRRELQAIVTGGITGKASLRDLSTIEASLTVEAKPGWYAWSPALGEGKVVNIDKAEGYPIVLFSRGEDEERLRVNVTKAVQEKRELRFFETKEERDEFVATLREHVTDLLGRFWDNRFHAPPDNFYTLRTFHRTLRHNLPTSEELTALEDGVRVTEERASQRGETFNGLSVWDQLWIQRIASGSQNTAMLFSDKIRIDREKVERFAEAACLPDGRIKGEQIERYAVTLFDYTLKRMYPSERGRNTPENFERAVSFTVETVSEQAAYIESFISALGVIPTADRTSKEERRAIRKERAKALSEQLRQPILEKIYERDLLPSYHWAAGEVAERTEARNTVVQYIHDAWKNHRPIHKNGVENDGAREITNKGTRPSVFQLWSHALDVAGVPESCIRRYGDFSSEMTRDKLETAIRSTPSRVITYEDLVAQHPHALTSIFHHFTDPVVEIRKLGRELQNRPLTPLSPEIIEHRSRKLGLPPTLDLNEVLSLFASEDESEVSIEIAPLDTPKSFRTEKTTEGLRVQISPDFAENPAEVARRLLTLRELPVEERMQLGNLLRNRARQGEEATDGI